MLTLRRKDRECIIIEAPGGDIITIKVIESSSEITKIGIDAPPIYKIMREEIIMSLQDIKEMTGLPHDDAVRYRDVLGHYQYRTGCSNMDLKAHHEAILEYARKHPGVSLIAAAFVCLARNQETVLRR